MHPDLVVTAYRHHERELEQRLAYRRAAAERAAAVAPASPTARHFSVSAARVTARAAAHRAIAALHRSRRFGARAYGTPECCPAV